MKMKRSRTRIGLKKVKGGYQVTSHKEPYGTYYHDELGHSHFKYTTFKTKKSAENFKKKAVTLKRKTGRYDDPRRKTYKNLYFTR